MKVSTTYTMEIELALTGVYHPPIAERGPSYASGGEPGEPAFVEDVNVEGATFERFERKLVGGKFETVRRTFDLFKGLDEAARAILISNIVEALGEEAEIALLEEDAE